MSNVKKTGIADLDAILEEAKASVDTMSIDKAMFDTVILPIMTNSIGMPDEERFEHLVNIWNNYGRPTIDTPDSPTARTSNGSLFRGFSILDKDGVEVATTPPLLQSKIVAGSSLLIDDYVLLQKSNCMEASRLLAKNINRVVPSSGNTEWTTFLEAYGKGSVLAPSFAAWDASEDDGLVEA